MTIDVLNPDLGTALHRQVFLLLRDEIARGEYSETGALPREEALRERFNVSRATVRRALANLAALGMVERRHGLGTFVRARTSLPRVGPSLDWVASLRQTVEETDVEVLSVGRETPSLEINSLLQIGTRQKAMHAVRLRSIKDTPVMLTDSWLPLAVSKGISATSLRRKALYDILVEHGIKFGRMVQEISAQSADPGRAELLGVEVGSPLLRFVKLLHDSDGQPVQHLTTFTAAERSRILMDVPGEGTGTLIAGQWHHDIARVPKERRPKTGAK